MPIYQYEASDPGKSCPKCTGGFGVAQPRHADKLAACPDCGAPICRGSAAPALGQSRPDLHYRAKRAGFHTYQTVQKGEYEKLY